MEIERKFLLKNDGWRSQTVSETKTVIDHVYLYNEQWMSIRVSTNVHYTPDLPIRKKVTLNIKIPRDSLMSREELEYDLDWDTGKIVHGFLKKDHSHIQKVRHYVWDEPQDIMWEIDCFTTKGLQELQIAEVELKDPAQEIILPDWIGQEVTFDPNYYNAVMVDALDLDDLPIG